MARTIAGKVIIITGASSGIGRAAAVLLGREGARLVLVARRENRLKELEAEIRGDMLSLPLDLRDMKQVEQMIHSAMDRYGRIDVLINNAAFGYLGSVESTSPEVVREIFDLNFEAPLLASQLVIPVMRAQGGGHIINISSVVGRRALPFIGIYSATKFALNGITESLRLEVKNANIDVSIISPAATRSEFGANVRRGDFVEPYKPMGGVQSSEEVAESIVRCIKDPKVEVFPNRLSRVLAWANGLAPSLVDKVLTHFYHDRLQALSAMKK